MVRTVHVSRVFHVDVESQPEVVEELRRLAARGFEVLGPLDLSPCGASPPPAADEPKRKSPGEIIDQICDRTKLSGASVAALVGVAPETLYNWRRAAANCREERRKSLERLLERCESLPAGSSQLRDEAAGAKRALRLALGKNRRRNPRISQETREAIVEMKKSGKSGCEIARTLGVSSASVYRLAESR